VDDLRLLRSKVRALAALFRAGLNVFCRKLVLKGGELLRNAQVYLGKLIRWQVLHSFGVNEGCPC
jgi:hypothetical protein